MTLAEPFEDEFGAELPAQTPIRVQLIRQINGNQDRSFVLFSPPRHLIPATYGVYLTETPGYMSDPYAQTMRPTQFVEARFTDDNILRLGLYRIPLFSYRSNGPLGIVKSIQPPTPVKKDGIFHLEPRLNSMINNAHLWLLTQSLSRNGNNNHRGKE